MSSHKRINLICLAIIALTVVLTLLFMNGKALGLRPIGGGPGDGTGGNSLFSDADLYDSWDVKDATQILLEGSTARVLGGGAYFHEGRVVISASGYYRLSGTLESGPVLVDADKGSKVFLMLDGAHLQCEDDACLWIEQADKVVLTLAQGSKNSIADAPSRSEEAALARRDGAIFARDDLSINGPGSLTVTAAYKHGIDAHDDLVLTGGKILVSAVRDALHVNDSLRLRNASLELEAGHVGLSQELPGGRFYMESGSLTVNSEGDAVHTAGDTELLGGTLTLSAADDAVHAEGSFLQSGGKLAISTCREGVEASLIRVSGGDVQLSCRVNGLNAALPADREDLAALKPLIEISGGSVAVLCAEGSHADGLDSNGDILISGGALLVSLADNKGNCALDWGRENGGILRITGGSVVCLDSGASTDGPDRSSTQPALLCGLGSTRAAGTVLVLEDRDGTELLRAEAPCSFSAALLSSPRLVKGTPVRLLVDGLVREISLDESFTVQGVFDE